MTVHDGLQRAKIGWQPDGSYVAMPYKFIRMWNLPDYGPIWARKYSNGETEFVITSMDGIILPTRDDVFSTIGYWRYRLSQRNVSQ